MPNVIANQLKELVKETVSSKFHHNRRQNRKSRRRSRRRRNTSSSRGRSSRDNSNRRDRIHRRRSKQSPRNPTYSELKNKFRFSKWCRNGCFSNSVMLIISPFSFILAAKQLFWSKTTHSKISKKRKNGPFLHFHSKMSFFQVQDIFCENLCIIKSVNLVSPMIWPHERLDQRQNLFHKAGFQFDSDQ